MKTKKRIKNFYWFILILILVVSFLGLSKLTQAAWYVTPQNSPISTDTEYCIGMDIGASGVPADYTGEFEFPAGFDLTGLLISDTEANSEVVLHLGTTTCSGGTARITEATPTADNDRDAASVSGQILTLVFEDTIAGPTTLSIEFRSQAGNSVVTPGSAGNYLLTLRLLDDSLNVVQVLGTMLYVGELNKVNISADVDPSITLTLSSTTCDLGTFSTTTIKTCNYYTEVDTNASGGYTGFIKDDGNLRNATNDIDDVADDETTATYEEYGVATSDADFASLDIDQQVTNCGSLDGGSAAAAVGLTGSDQSYAYASTPVDNDQVTLCHAAAISGATAAGAYAHLITITVVGNF